MAIMVNLYEFREGGDVKIEQLLSQHQILLMLVELFGLYFIVIKQLKALVQACFRGARPILHVTGVYGFHFGLELCHVVLCLLGEVLLYV